MPLAELRAAVAAMRPQADLQPFAGQAAHEARAAQQNLMAQLEVQRVGLANWHREQQTVRQAQASLAEQQGQSIAALAQQARAPSVGTSAPSWRAPRAAVSPSLERSRGGGPRGRAPRVQGAGERYPRA